MSLTNRSFDAGKIGTPKASGVDPSGPFAAMVVLSHGVVRFIDQSGHDSGPSGDMPAGTEILVKGVRLVSPDTTATVLLLKAPL